MHQKIFLYDILCFTLKKAYTKSRKRERFMIDLLIFKSLGNIINFNISDGKILLKLILVLTQHFRKNSV